MVAITTAYSSNAYLNLTSSSASTGSATTASAVAPSAVTATSTSATSITLSDAAKAALAAKDFLTVVAEARSKLNALLKEADRTSPLEDDALALDLSSLDPRELFAMASDDTFTPDEQSAASLEMQRRFESAMAGPAAVADVTGNYTGLYKAAAAYLDGLGSEEKSGADWIAGRAALTEGLTQLQADPKSLPDTGDADPVALYLALREAGETAQPTTIEDSAKGMRKSLDALYATAIKAGKVPTFNKQTTIGTYVDMAQFDSRSLSSIVLDKTAQFSSEEVKAARETLQAKSGAALLAGFQSAAKSSDPTAFSQNIISIYASMSSEERSAAGWTDQFYQAAVDSYQSTSKLTQMLAEAGGSSTGFLSWMGK